MGDTRWIDTAEGAKMIRVQLRRAFPGHKFSVRIDRYSGGSSTNISWIDGPTEAEVRVVTDGFAGARFDGMIDLAYCADSWYCPTHGARAARTYGHSYDRDASGYGVGNGIDASRCCADAELVHFGSSYVFARRELSPQFRAELEAAVARAWGVDYDPSRFDGERWMSQDVHMRQVEITRYVRPDAVPVR